MQRELIESIALSQSSDCPHARRVALALVARHPRLKSEVRKFRVRQRAQRLACRYRRSCVVKLLAGEFGLTEEYIRRILRTQ